MPTPNDPYRGADPQALTAAELDACTLGSRPPWGLPVAQDLMATLLAGDTPFPCVFAVTAARKRSLRFGFVESAHDDGTWGPLVDILNAYLECYQELGRDTSLVVFFRPDEPDEPVLTLDGYFHRFWSVLQFLHDKDGRPWPRDTPTDPEDAWWEFSFGGTEIFVVCNTPAHVRRHSRYSPGFMITFQPRWVFDGLGPHTARGSTARRVIRQRIRRFDDGMAPAAELGDHGHPDNREWRQYFLPDAPGGSVPACPFHAGRDRRPSPDQPSGSSTMTHPAEPDTGTAQPASLAGPAAAGSAAPAPVDEPHAAVVNDEGQYSLWPLWRPLPDGWHDTGVHGDRERCLAHIERAWTDMRPRGLSRDDLRAAG